MIFYGIRTYQTTKHLALVPDQCDQLIQILTVQAQMKQRQLQGGKFKTTSLQLSVQGITDATKDKGG